MRAADRCVGVESRGHAGATGSLLPLPRGAGDSMKPGSLARLAISACPTPAAHRRLF